MTPRGTGPGMSADDAELLVWWYEVAATILGLDTTAGPPPVLSTQPPLSHPGGLLLANAPVLAGPKEAAR